MKKNSLQKALSLKVGVLWLWGSLLVVQRDQEGFTRNPFWQWSPNTISIWWCWGFTAWPWLVPQQCLEAGTLHLSRATRSEQGHPRGAGLGLRHRSMARAALVGSIHTGAALTLSKRHRQRLGCLSNRQPPWIVPSRSCWARQDLFWQEDVSGWWPHWVMPHWVCTSVLAGKLPSPSAGPSGCSGATLCTFVPPGRGGPLLLLSEGWKRRSG